MHTAAQVIPGTLRVTAHGASEDLASPEMVLGALICFSEAGLWGMQGAVGTKGPDGTLVIDVTLAPTSMPQVSILPSESRKADRSGPEALRYAPSPQQFSRLFPFHILVDGQGSVLQVRFAACMHGQQPSIVKPTWPGSCSPFILSAGWRGAVWAAQRRGAGPRLPHQQRL